MVDLLSRMGLIDEAYKLIKSIPVKPNSVIWKTVLGACKVHGAVELAEEAFQVLCAIAPLSDDTDDRDPLFFKSSCTSYRQKLCRLKWE